MNRYFETTWLRTAMLLGALSAGAMMTRVIPTYEEIAAHRNQQEKPGSASRVRESPSNRMTRVDVDHRSLVQRSS